MAHDVNQGEKDVAAQVRSALVDRIGAERYDLWITDGTQWSWTDGTLVLGFESEAGLKLAQTILRSDISSVATEVAGNCEVSFEVLPSRPMQSEIAESELDSVSSSLSAPRKSELPTTDAEPSTTQPQRKLSVVSEATVAQDSSHPISVTSPIKARFIAGDSNKLVWTTAKLVTDEPGKLNPVFVHGPNGSGKSLSAAAIAQDLRSVKRLRRVAHMTSEQFTNDFTEGLRGGGLPMFRRKYRDVDALIVEDIQFFVGKRSTMAELRFTIDELTRRGKQVYLTADRSLNELDGLGSDLVGLLRGGLVVPVFPLDRQVRAQLLSQLLSEAGVQLEANASEQLAERMSGDGRVVNGVVKRLVAFSMLHLNESGEKRPLTWDECWEAVSDLVHATQPVVRLRDIERAVCDMFGLEADSLQSKSKMRSVSQPRMLAMFLARKYTPAAYKEIGQHFGKRRHSTVISAEKTVTSWLSGHERVELARGMSVHDAIRQVESKLQVG